MNVRNRIHFSHWGPFNEARCVPHAWETFPMTPDERLLHSVMAIGHFIELPSVVIVPARVQRADEG